MPTKLELDHVFILVPQEAEVGDALVSLGLEESFRRDHKGQGTSNRRFVFSNGMLELLWLRDEEEANAGTGRALNLSTRFASDTASPFGVVLSRQNAGNQTMPFSGWRYQPDYFPSGMAFLVGDNASNINEPLCIYAPFIEPAEKPIKEGKFASLSRVILHVAGEALSEVLKTANKAQRLSIVADKEHYMELFLDQHASGQSKDFRPAIPLIIHW